MSFWGIIQILPKTSSRSMQTNRKTELQPLLAIAEPGLRLFEHIKEERLVNVLTGLGDT